MINQTTSDTKTLVIDTFRTFCVLLWKDKVVFIYIRLLKVKIYKNTFNPLYSIEQIILNLKGSVREKWKGV